MAGFIAAPTHIRTDDGDDRTWLKLPDHLVVAVPVVLLPLAVGSLSAGAVEPDLADLAVVAEQLPQLVAEVLVVAC